MAWRGVALVLFPLLSSALGKGLFSGVPCALSYRCISESSNMMAEIPSTFLEHECQAACAAFSGCVSYTWASERAGELDMEPYLCQLFTSCDRSYDSLQRVSSGHNAHSKSQHDQCNSGHTDHSGNTQRTVRDHLELILRSLRDRSF